MTVKLGPAIASSQPTLQPDIVEVYKSDVMVGELIRHNDSVEFRYLDHYKAINGTPVSQSLPLDGTGYMKSSLPGQLPPFFAGLLPQGARLDRIAQTIGVSRTDELSILAATGADCIGDVFVKPRHTAPRSFDRLSAVDGRSEAVRLAGRSLGAHVYNLQGTQRMSDAPVEVPVQDASIAGEAELLVGRETTARPNDNRSYFVLLNSAEFPDIVARTQLAMRAAQRAGIDVPANRLAVVAVNTERQPALIIERFDRYIDGHGSERRLASENAGQMLGLRPEYKASISLDVAFDALNERCGNIREYRVELFRRFAFANATGLDVDATQFGVVTNRAGVTTLAPAMQLVDLGRSASDSTSTIATMPEGDLAAADINTTHARLTDAQMIEFAHAINIGTETAESTLAQVNQAARGMARASLQGPNQLAI